MCKFCVEEKKVRNETVDYLASPIARDTMPEPLVIDFEPNDDDSQADTGTESKNEICIALK